MRILQSWDDYRYFASLAQTGSIRASAEALGVNPSTVSRRLVALERRLGQKLFERSHAGLELTADGRALAERLSPLAAGLSDLESAVSDSGDTGVAGTVRISLPEGLAIVLMPDFAALSEQHPHLQLELVPDAPGRQRSDLLIRVTDDPPEDLVGRQLGYACLAVYGSRAYLSEHDPIGAPESCRWIESRIELQRAPAFRDRFFPRVPVGLRSHGVLLQQAAVTAGLGITLLPCVLGDSDERLVRVGELEPLPAQPIWLLFHPDQRGLARIRIISDHLQAAFERLAPLLHGRSAPASEETTS